MASPKKKKTVTKKSVAKKPVTKKTTTKKTVTKKTAQRKPKATEPKLEQAADIPESEIVLQQEAVSQIANKNKHSSKKRQGTTLVVPQEQQNKRGALAPEESVVPEGGGDFNPRTKPAESKRALAPESDDAADPEFTPAQRPPAKLERLQKILAAAGVASRRSAEAMIEQGRVQVNGKVVTVLGTKADAARDHIRVDGKLLQGPERHRYFVLNKPRGFVTTVKDPEGRPTVMQFFSKFSERLYPVGRLDYLSEGLLVVTNDGDLANRLTKASSGVEKTYLVKVAGQPTEAELNILRGGVAIERGKPGSPSVRTSPARIRQVRQGDNPWYEVVLIEGRNRELRKMFEEVGHFVEKIRRVGYGPLVLDQEPGSLRELQPQELAALRKAADGTLRTPKSKELRRRNLMDAGQLPTVLPKPSSRLNTARPPARFAAASTGENHPAPIRPGDFRPKKFATGHTNEFRPKIFGADRDRTSRPADSFASGAANKFFRPARPGGFPPKKFGAERVPRPAGSYDKSAAKPFRTAGSSGEGRPFTAKPAWKKPERPARPGAERFRPPAGRSFDRPPARPASRPAWKKDDRPTRPPSRFATGSTGEGRPSAGRPFTAKPAWNKPERPASNRSGFDRSGPARPERSARPPDQRPAAQRREAPARAARVFDEDLGPVRPPNLHIEEIAGPARPFTTSSGKPRAGGARPGWKPRPSGPGKPASGSRSRPKFGAPTDRSSSGGWKSGYKAKPGGKKHS
jgi:23S rRNA pseudouridine2605 synthase